MTTKKEISKDYRLNDIVFELEEGVPALNSRTGEEIFGVVTQNFLFSAPYRVGKQALLARIDDFGGRVFFDGGFATGTETMTTDRAERYTTQYLRFQGILKDVGKYTDPNAKVDFLDIKTAIYDTPQPALDGGLPLNALEVKGRLTKSV